MNQDVRTKWGRSKLGGGRVPAMGVAIPAGLALGAVLGLVAVWLGVAGPDPVIGGTVYAVLLALPTTSLVYVLVVDRTTMVGATERPEESVESGWYDRAAAGAFSDIVIVAGLGATALAFIPADLSVDPMLLLVGVIIVSFASFALRYLLLQRKG